MRRRGYAAAQFFPWQRTIPRASDINGQIFRPVMRPSSPSCHIDIHLRDPAGVDLEESPAPRAGMDPELDRYPLPPGNLPEGTDILLPEAEYVCRSGDLLPGPSDVHEEDAVIPVAPGDQVDRGGVPHGPDDAVPLPAEDSAGHRLHGTAPRAVGRGRRPGALMRMHPAPAPRGQGWPDTAGQGRRHRRGACRPARSTSRSFGWQNADTAALSSGPSGHFPWPVSKKVFCLPQRGA